MGVFGVVYVVEEKIEIIGEFVLFFRGEQLEFFAVIVALMGNEKFQNALIAEVSGAEAVVIKAVNLGVGEDPCNAL